MRPATVTSAREAAGEALEQAVRELIHHSRPALGRLADPAEASEVLATLAAVTGMLPQLLDQLARGLLSGHDDGRLRLDDDAPDPDARHAVHAAAAALEHAGGCLHRAAQQLDTAHQHTAHLLTDTSGGGGGGGGERWCAR